MSACSSQVSVFWLISSWRETKNLKTRIFCCFVVGNDVWRTKEEVISWNQWIQLSSNLNSGAAWVDFCKSMCITIQSLKCDYNKKQLQNCFSYLNPFTETKLQSFAKLTLQTALCVLFDLYLDVSYGKKKKEKIFLRSLQRGEMASSLGL